MTSERYELTTFGGLVLRTSNGESVGTLSGRRLALLAVLAAHGADGVARDRLMLLFWPDSTRDRARNALHQAVHAIRAALGPSSVETGPLELRVNPDIVRSDVTAFRTKIAAGDLASAVTLYTGPFLDSIHIKQALEFERWADAERRGLSSVYVRVVDSLYERAMQEESWAEALECANRLLGVERTDSAILKQMRAQSAAERAEQVVSRSETPRQSVRRAFPIAASLTIAAASLLGVSVAILRSEPQPISLSDDAMRDRQEVLAEREKSLRGRVFIETPVVHGESPKLDSLAGALAVRMSRDIDLSKIAHVVPRDSVVAIESAAAQTQGLISSQTRLARANAGIGIMTIMTQRGDSIDVRVAVQRRARPTRPSRLQRALAFFRRQSSTKNGSNAVGIETSVAVARMTVPIDRPYALMWQLVGPLSRALDGMRSCNVNDHVAQTTLPWCWRAENEPVVIPGIYRARRRSPFASVQGLLPFSL